MRSISSSTAPARAVVVAVGIVMSALYPLSHLLQPFPEFPRASLGPARARAHRFCATLLGFHPRPQFRAEKHSPGRVKRCRVFGLFLSGRNPEAPCQHWGADAGPNRIGWIPTSESASAFGIANCAATPQGRSGPRSATVSMSRPSTWRTLTNANSTATPAAHSTNRRSCSDKAASSALSTTETPRDDKLFHTGLRSSARTSCSTRKSTFAMALVHHMWTETAPLRTSSPARRRCRHAARGVRRPEPKPLSGYRNPVEPRREKYASSRFHRRIARDDRLSRFAAEVLDFGQPAFGCPHQRRGGDRGRRPLRTVGAAAVGCFPTRR